VRASPAALAYRARRVGLWAFVASAVIVADQLTKSWARHALAAHKEHFFASVYLLLTYNSGAAFSLGSGAVPVIEAVAIALVAALFWLSGHIAKRGAGSALTVGFGLVAGGALSNLGDRFFRHDHGAVVDFVQLVSWWPVFNLADAAITIGAVTVAVGSLAASWHEGTPPPGAGAAQPAERERREPPGHAAQ
jgi:signal peptidase II